MKLYEFMDVEYYNKTIAMSAKRAQDQFDLKSQAETQVAQKFIIWQRNWYKFVAHFTLLFSFTKATLTGKFPTKIEPKKEPQDKTLTLVNSTNADATKETTSTSPAH